jgi:hypothetical protein
MKKMIIGLLVLSSLSAKSYSPTADEIRNFVNDGLISGITEFIDIKAGDNPKRVHSNTYIYCRECPTDGRQCQQLQFQNGDTAINLIPGDVKLIDDGIMIRCVR